MLKRLLSVGLLALVSLGAGCGSATDRHKLPLVPASGILTIPGVNVSELGLLFVPDDQKLTNAWCLVGADGTFRVSTYEPGDGIAVGAYTVVLSGGVGTLPGGETRLSRVGPHYLSAEKSPWKVEISPDLHKNVITLVVE